MKPTQSVDNLNKEKSAPAAGDLFYRQIAMGGPCLTAIVRANDLRVLFVNKEFEDCLGYENANLEKEPLYIASLFEEFQLDRFTYQLKLIKDNTDAQSRYVIYGMRNRQGETRSYCLFAAPALVDSPDGHGLFHLSMFKDNSKWEIPFTSFTTKELFLEHFDGEDFGTFEWILPIDKVFWSAGLHRIYEVDSLYQQLNVLLEDELIHPADRQRVHEETNKALTSTGFMDIEYRIVTAEHNIKIIHCIARTLNDQDGNTLKLAGSIRDVTRQRSIEEDLKNNVRDLYHSNKDLEEFAYIASHDLQEPLRKISIFSDRLAERYGDLLTGDGARYLSRMIAAADNMRSLIEDLLQFSRVTKNPQPFELVKFDEILAAVTSELELVIEETSSSVSSANLPQIEAIPSQMRQLFLNLIGNAIKFHKPDVTPVISIKASVLTPAEAAGNGLTSGSVWHKIEVTDNGVGFEEEYATRIFQVFQRLHGKSEYPGSGIGLAICKKIVEFHNGVIYAQNIPGEGSRFVFILPGSQQNAKAKTS